MTFSEIKMHKLISKDRMQASNSMQALGSQELESI